MPLGQTGVGGENQMRVILMTAALVAAPCAAQSAPPPPPFVPTSSQNTWNTIGDIGAVALPVGAAVMTWAERDKNGFIQLAETGGATLATVTILKYAVDTTRPNGDSYSFPSMHTAGAAAAAGFVTARYGWKAGLPFQLGAGLVGLARVESGAHYWYDVVAGAAIGEGFAFLFTQCINNGQRDVIKLLSLSGAAIVDTGNGLI